MAMAELEQQLQQVEQDFTEAWREAAYLERLGAYWCFMAGAGDTVREASRFRIREMLREGEDWTLPLSPEQLIPVRAALDNMPDERWKALNNTVFEIHRGNVFDETFEPKFGGGIKYHFGPRYEMFLELVEKEREYLKLYFPTVLDVGCWQGTLVCELLQRKFAAGGIDICESALCEADLRVSWLHPDCRMNHLELREVSIWEFYHLMDFRYPLEQQRVLKSFDIITCQETLEHIPTRYLQASCDKLLEIADYSILITVPGWDDGWPAHLRVFTSDDFRRLFHADKHSVEILQEPGGGVYTTVRVRKCDG